MTRIAWLQRMVPGFADLGDDERQVILEFTLLWSLFEANALGTRASATRIIQAVTESDGRGRLNPEAYEDHLAYFCDRYFQAGAATPHFRHLQLRDNDRPDLVARVLQRQQSTPIERVSALLIVVYRLRNNFFHGYKWAYELRGQEQNFLHASEVLTIGYEQLVHNAA